MSDTPSRLDGNVTAGALSTVFSFDATTARCTCAACRKTAVLAELHVYIDAPGTVARCPWCGTVVLRYAATPDGTWLDLRGGFDNLWYVLQGSASTGHSTGPGGAIERVRLTAGSLLWLRTERGAWHAESVGADEIEEGRGDTEFRGVLFWVNLARKDKHIEPTAIVLRAEQIPMRTEGDATVRVLVGEGSPIELGTPGLILDVELPDGGQMTALVPPEFQGFAYVLDGEAAFGANKPTARPPQLVLFGSGKELTATDASPAPGAPRLQRALR